MSDTAPVHEVRQVSVTPAKHLTNGSPVIVENATGDRLTGFVLATRTWGLELMVEHPVGIQPGDLLTIHCDHDNFLTQVTVFHPLGDHLWTVEVQWGPRS